MKRSNFPSRRCLKFYNKLTILFMLLSYVQKHFDHFDSICFNPLVTSWKKTTVATTTYIGNDNFCLLLVVSFALSLTLKLENKASSKMSFALSWLREIQCKIIALNFKLNGFYIVPHRCSIGVNLNQLPSWLETFGKLNFFKRTLQWNRCFVDLNSTTATAVWKRSWLVSNNDAELNLIYKVCFFPKIRREHWQNSNIIKILQALIKHENSSLFPACRTKILKIKT